MLRRLRLSMTEGHGCSTSASVVRRFRVTSHRWRFCNRQSVDDFLAARTEITVVHDVLAVLPAASALPAARGRPLDRERVRGLDVDVRDDEELREIDAGGIDVAVDDHVRLE